MHVIITGGTGLIGTALVQNLLEDGHQVTVLSRSPQKKQSPALDGANVVGWDSRTAEGWGHLADGADAIVNLAGAGIADRRWSAERKRQILESRVDAGKAVMEAIRNAKQKPKVLIQSSAVGFYGPSDDRELSERSSPGSDYLAQVCFEWEASTAGAKALGVRRPVIRTGIVLSTKGGALPKMLLPFQFFIGGPLGSGKQYFPWIHIADEVRAIRFLLESPDADGPYNLAAPNPPTNAEFSKQLGEAMSRPSLMPVPGFGLKILFGEMSTVLLDGQRAVPQKLQDAGFDFNYTEAVPALTDVLQNKK
ncbi:MAG: TIGR01777 family oxidoreductase [Caldilineaceae bacterium]|nr:TIGR01777 family oxidoreductase [Caldilineaceae bacterium]